MNRRRSNARTSTSPKLSPSSILEPWSLAPRDYSEAPRVVPGTKSTHFEALVASGSRTQMLFALS